MNTYISAGLRDAVAGSCLHAPSAIARDVAARRRWLRHEAALWIRPDAARFLLPGTRIDDVYPALLKIYRPSQPRVPAGSGRESGRWTNGGVNAQGRPRVIIDTTDLDNEADSATSDNGAGGTPINDSRVLSDADADPDPIRPGAQYAQVGSPRGVGDNGGPPLEEPQEIPKKEPAKSSQTTAILRSAALWMGRALRLGVAIDVLVRSFDEAEWIQQRRAEAETYLDPPRTLQELRDAVDEPRAGTENHHIAEQTALEKLGFRSNNQCTRKPGSHPDVEALRYYGLVQATQSGLRRLDTATISCRQASERKNAAWPRCPYSVQGDEAMRKVAYEHKDSCWLVAKFLDLAIAKGQAVMGDETAKASRIYWEIDSITSILRSRKGDDRRLLSALHQHPNPSVRLEAATATLAVNPQASRDVLRLISDRHEFPFAGTAGMRLHNLETGLFRPT